MTTFDELKCNKCGKRPFFITDMHRAITYTCKCGNSGKIQKPSEEWTPSDLPAPWQNDNFQRLMARQGYKK